MGLAVSNARMLFLSQRASDLQAQLMKISNDRQTAAYNSQSIFDAYQTKLDSLQNSISNNKTFDPVAYAKSQNGTNVAVTTVTGAVTGAAAGATMGCAIGTCIPVIGNVVGAVAGGVVGGLVGGISSFFSAKKSASAIDNSAALLKQVADMNHQNTVDSASLQAASADYQANMNKLNTIDSGYEQKEGQLQTQLQAVQAELDSVTKERDKNAGKGSGFDSLG